MIRWALTFIVNRLIFVGLFVLALNAFSQGSSCQPGNPQGLSRTLAGLPDALKTLSHSLR